MDIRCDTNRPNSVSPVVVKQRLNTRERTQSEYAKSLTDTPQNILARQRNEQETGAQLTENDKKKNTVNSPSRTLAKV